MGHTQTVVVEIGGEYLIDHRDVPLIEAFFVEPLDERAIRVARSTAGRQHEHQCDRTDRVVAPEHVHAVAPADRAARPRVRRAYEERSREVGQTWVEIVNVSRMTGNADGMTAIWWRAGHLDRRHLSHAGRTNHGVPPTLCETAGDAGGQSRDLSRRLLSWRRSALRTAHG